MSGGRGGGGVRSKACLNHNVVFEFVLAGMVCI